MLDTTAIDQEIRRRGHGWVTRRNHLTEGSDGYRRAHLGAVPPPGTQVLTPPTAPAAIAPTAFVPSPLWPYAAHVPSINQGPCGDCAGASTFNQMAALIRICAQDPARNLNASLADLYFCGAGRTGATCSTGAWMSVILDYLKSAGSLSDADYPYQPQDQGCMVRTAALAARVIKIASWTGPITDLAAMKTWLDTIGPLTVTLMVYQDFYAYGGGIYKVTSTVQEGLHAVCLWDLDLVSGTAFCINSWGPTWGEVGPNGLGGWFRIALGQSSLLGHGAFGAQGVSSPYYNLPPQPVPPPPPPPSLPVFTSPANKATGVSRQPTIAWVRSQPPTCYWLKIGTAFHASYIADSGPIMTPYWTPPQSLPVNTHLYAALGTLDTTGKWLANVNLEFTTGA
jgi:hypothetical protein